MQLVRSGTHLYHHITFILSPVRRGLPTTSVDAGTRGAAHLRMVLSTAGAKSTRCVLVIPQR